VETQDIEVVVVSTVPKYVFVFKFDFDLDSFLYLYLQKQPRILLDGFGFLSAHSTCFLLLILCRSLIFRSLFVFVFRKTAPIR